MERYQFNSNFLGESGTDWTYVSEYVFALIACTSISIIVYLNYRNSMEQGGKFEKNNKYVKWHLEEEITKAREEIIQKQKLKQERREKRKASEKALSLRRQKEKIKVKEIAKPTTPKVESKTK